MYTSNNIKIEEFTPDTDQLNLYALAFRKSCQNWINYLGESIYMTSEGFEENAEELIELISKTSPTKCIALLNKYKLLPEKLYRITEVSSEVSNSMPIYTGIRQISLEGDGSILAEAFFGAEVHLLEATGRLLSIFHHEYPPNLGLGQMYLIDQNSLYDSQVKGRHDDPTAMEIVGYASENIDKSISFYSEYGKEYRLENQGQIEKIILGTGEYITVSNLKKLGKYVLMKKLNEEDNAAHDCWGLGGETWVFMFSYHVGLEWKNIPDFTIQYNTFPFLNGRDNWVLNAKKNGEEEKVKLFKECWQNIEFIEYHLSTDPFCFQFMPIEIRSNRFWVEKFCLKEPVNFLFVDVNLRNDKQFAIDLIKLAGYDTIYPYSNENIRKDLDILIVLRETGRLYDLPDPKDIGPEKINDIREFVSNNQSRIEEILNLFPNALQYAPVSLLNNRELLLKALPFDNELVFLLTETHLDDPEIIMAASSKYFAALEFASKRLCEDPQFVMSILTINGENIRFAADWMKSDRNFVLVASKSGARIFDFVSECFKDDEEVILNMVKQNGFALENASERLRIDKAFNLKALDHGAYYRNCIHESLLDDRDIVLKAMQNHPHEFENIPKQFKADREIVLAVVSRKGGYGRYIADCCFEMRDDPEIIKAAIKYDGWNIQHASQRLLDDYYFLAEIIYEQPDSIKHMPDVIKNDRLLCELARRRKIEIGEISKIESNSDNSQSDILPF